MNFRNSCIFTIWISELIGFLDYYGGEKVVVPFSSKHNRCGMHENDILRNFKYNYALKKVPPDKTWHISLGDTLNNAFKWRGMKDNPNLSVGLFGFYGAPWLLVVLGRHERRHCCNATNYLRSRAWQWQATTQVGWQGEGRDCVGGLSHGTPRRDTATCAFFALSEKKVILELRWRLCGERFMGIFVLSIYFTYTELSVI